MHNNIDLVTVTCTRDRGIQQLQSYSIDLMLTAPCDHYILIEDNQLGLQAWYDTLSPYYTHHRLHLIAGNSLLPPDCYANDSRRKNGWHRSAVLKLLAATKVQSEKYLMLDSKNFFVHPQLLDDWPITDGNGIVEDYDNRGWVEIDKFCISNNIPIPKKVYNSSTPFMVDTAIVREIVKHDILALFFDKKEWWSSEIFLYSIFSQYAGNQLQSRSVPNVTFWNTERNLDKSTLTDVHTWPNMRTFGIHRDVCRLGKDLTEFIYFLNEIGFDRNTVENMLTQYELDIDKNQ